MLLSLIHSIVPNQTWIEGSTKLHNYSSMSAEHHLIRDFAGIIFRHDRASPRLWWWECHLKESLDCSSQTNNLQREWTYTRLVHTFGQKHILLLYDTDKDIPLFNPRYSVITNEILDDRQLCKTMQYCKDLNRKVEILWHVYVHLINMRYTKAVDKNYQILGIQLKKWQILTEISTWH